MPIPFTDEKKLEWKSRIDSQKKSLLTAAQWCRDNLIQYDTFLYWRKRFSTPVSRAINPPAFKELTDLSAVVGITIEIQQIQIHLTKQFDPIALAKCLRVIKDLSC
jgi:hypothetical protein